VNLIFVIPLTLFLAVVAGFVFLRGSRKDLAISVGAGVLISILDLWAIFQSRSSTAAIGVLLIPFLASGTLAIVWLAERGRKANSRLKQILAYVGYAIVFCGGVWIVKTGFDTRARNAVRDEMQKELSNAHEEKRRTIRDFLKVSPGLEAERLEEFIVQHETDDLWIAAALEFDQVQPARLEKLAATKKFDLRIAGHIHTPSELIERIYRETPNKNYIAPMIARSKNTPARLLRELDQNSQDRTLDNAFVENPSMPPDILERISKVANAYQMQKLLENPSSNCATILNLEQSSKLLKVYYQNWLKERLPTIKSRACEKPG
jgi:hypothetical protein